VIDRKEAEREEIKKAGMGSEVTGWTLYLYRVE
jgi:hypothetical protein